MATVTAEVPGSDSVTEDEGGNRELTRVFAVKCNTGEYAYSAMRASGIPARYEQHPEDPDAYAYKASVRSQGNERCYYHVTITYSTLKRQDPADELPEVSWEDEEFERTVEKDRNDDAILNAAGDRYEEPVTFTDSRPVLRVVRNEPVFDPLAAYQYNRSVNSDTFYGAVPGTMRAKITGDMKWRDGVQYWRVTYVFRYNPDGWQPEVLEQGLYQIASVDDGSGGTEDRKLPCTVKGKSPNDSEPVSYAVPIDADGKQIDPDDLPTNAVYTQWDIFNELPFANLNIYF